MKLLWLLMMRKLQQKRSRMSLQVGGFSPVEAAWVGAGFRKKRERMRLPMLEPSFMPTTFSSNLTDHFARERPPNVLITTCYNASALTYKFIAELLEVFPNATFYKRRGFELKKIVEYAKHRDFTDVVVINEDRRQINGMLVTHLPEGPTARFRLSNLKLSDKIKGHGRATSHRPEVVLNNFTTRLGHRVGRLFASLFHQDPAFRGRRVVTFHNQRDYIFFRHHRYIFEEHEVKGSTGAKDVKARLQEIGPRFTLRLESLQKGTFDSKHGEFEWINSSDQDVSRRKFKL